MKKTFPLFLSVLLFFSASCFANDYFVDTIIDDFIVSEGEVVFIELEIEPKPSDWIVDSSGQSEIYSDDCIKSSATVWIHAKVEGVGLKEIGPFYAEIGNETIKSQPMKVYVLPKLDDKNNFSVIAKKDPNGKNLFQIKIDYKINSGKGVIEPIDLIQHSLPNGVEIKSGSSGYGGDTGNCSYTFEILLKDNITLDRNNFENIPDWVEFPKITIPAKPAP